MKITNKFLPVLAGLAILSTLIIGCKKDQPEDEPYGITIDTQKDKASYGDTYTLKIKVADEETAPTEEEPNPTKKVEITAENAASYGVTITEDSITLKPDAEKTEFYISGYFKGQIVNEKKGTILNLENAYLENDKGPAILVAIKKTKLEIAVKSGTNYVITTAEDSNAIETKNLEIGGSGTCYITGTKHGIKGNDIEFKGSGTYYIQGAAMINDDESTGGSAINGENFLIEEGKTVTIYAINSKNGIKADYTINIAGGTINLLNNNVGLKTDLLEKDPEKEHSITLSGGTIYDCKNNTFYITEEGFYNAEGAQINKVDELPALN